MATLTIRDLPDDVRDRLRIEAAVKGRKRRSAAEWDAIVARAQEAFAPFRSADVSIVDELIAERRLEAWKETAEALEELRRSGKPDLEAAVRPSRDRHGA